jgi:hypothetical protein
MSTKKFVPEEPLAKDEGPVLTVADELLAAIKLAKTKDQSCEVQVDLRKAQKLLRNLGYIFHNFRAGILLNFPQKLEAGQKPKAQIYVHD